MITYVNSVLVSNKTTGAVLTAAPAYASNANSASADAGKFVIMDLDSSTPYNVTADTKRFKIGVVTKNNNASRVNGAIKYVPVVKWSNIILKDDIKSINSLTYAADTEDIVNINFDGLDANVLATLATGGKRIVIRITYKDLPTRYRSWTESYEYVTKHGDTKATIATGVAKIINDQYKRARVTATATGSTVKLEAMKYDDDNSNESINWSSKVRFNANIYYTDPEAAGFASKNKYFPTGVTINKVPGKEYAASAKLVRDRESQSLGYEGILNRGAGTFPVIKPAIEADINARYDALTIEFENMYRAADDIHRKTKQTVEIYGITGQLAAVIAKINTIMGISTSRVVSSDK